MLSRDAADCFECAVSHLGQEERIAATIFLVVSTFNHSTLPQLVEEGDQPAGVQSEPVAESLLGQTLLGMEDA